MENPISIHLMLMLIRKEVLTWQDKKNFNKSHVNVNHPTLTIAKSICSYFNTSHVNVNQALVGIL